MYHANHLGLSQNKRCLAGAEARAFLTDTFRFRNDYQDVDVRSYLEFFSNDGCTGAEPCNGYPVGGM